MKRVTCITAYAAVVTLLLTEAHRSEAALSDCIDATCRITAADGSRGTGCVFEIGRDHVHVLTAAHVVGDAETVSCEFWQQGHRSRPLPARVLARVEDARCDAAVVVLAASQFGGRLPAAVPIAPPDYIVRPGAAVTSVGCARGSWSTGFKGHALGYRGADLCFTPTPADGRSGSAIFDAEGAMIVGLLRARTSDGAEGIACSLQSLYAALGRPAGQQEAQCGPGGCPLTPGRWRPQQSPQPVWPTMPSPQPAPSVDLAPIGEKLDGIARLLQEMKAERREPPEAGPAASAAPLPPPADQQAIEVAGVTARLDKTEQAVDGLHGQVKGWIAEHGSLKERMEARLERVKQQLGEEASQREVRIAYLKDLISEKLAGGGVVGLLKLLGMPTAVIFAAWFVSRRIHGKLEAGEPLLVQKLVAEVGELRGRIRGRLRPEEDKE